MNKWKNHIPANPELYSRREIPSSAEKRVLEQPKKMAICPVRTTWLQTWPGVETLPETATTVPALPNY